MEPKEEGAKEEGAEGTSYTHHLRQAVKVEEEWRPKDILSCL